MGKDQVIALTGAALEQLALADFINEGRFDRHEMQRRRYVARTAVCLRFSFLLLGRCRRYDAPAKTLVVKTRHGQVDGRSRKPPRLITTVVVIPLAKNILRMACSTFRSSGPDFRYSKKWTFMCPEVAASSMADNGSSFLV
jgi:hypothetical protein